jgi:hypothetical protein
MCARLEVEPPRTSYHRIFSNFQTLVILLQIDLTFGDEFEIVYEGCSKIKNIYIFAWSLVPNIKYYRWLRGPFRQLFLNSKTDYHIHTIRRILDFL